MVPYATIPAGTKFLFLDCTLVKDTDTHAHGFTTGAGYEMNPDDIVEPFDDSGVGYDDNKGVL